MNKIYLGITFEKLKQLFIDKYLITSVKVSKNSQSRGLQLQTDLFNEDLFNNRAERLIFLSYFDKVFVDKTEKNMLEKLFHAPPGFIIERERKPDHPELDKIELTPDKHFHISRNSLLHAFSILYLEYNDLLQIWFSFVLEREYTNPVTKILMNETIETNGYPRATMSTKLATASIHKLQFIELGKQLRNLYFKELKDPQSDPKYTEHRDWLMQFDPDTTKIHGLPIPEKFKPAINVILGYLVALDNSHVDMPEPDQPRSHMRWIDVKYDKLLQANEDQIINPNLILFHALYFIGLLRDEYQFTWHTNVSKILMRFIEETAFESIRKDCPKELFGNFSVDDLYDSVSVEHIEKYTAYAEMISNQKSITGKDKDLVKVAQRFKNHLLGKRNNIFFVHSSAYLSFIKSYLFLHNEPKNILLIKYFQLDEKNESLSKMISTKEANDLQVELSKTGKNVQVILRNNSNPNNRDTINGIKGFCSTFGVTNESDFAFDSESNNDLTRQIELECIIGAMHDVPLYSPEKDYFFV